MPTKAEQYAQMADQVARQLTGSWQEWAGFLTTAARLYKYPFHEQMMIYAQRPDATACAEYDLWNNRMGRYVRRGSKGIALVDDSGDRPRLRYVFDISDTGRRENSRTPWLWTLNEERTAPVMAMLERNYAAALYLAYADGDRANYPQDAADLTVTALAGGITELDFGDVTRGALCDAVPAGQRLVLARTTSVAIGALIDTGTVTRTYEESLTAFEPTDGDALVVTDTATLEALEQAGGSYTILRDYGDVFWDIRMNINNVTNNFANPFTLPEAPQRGAGRK